MSDRIMPDTTKRFRFGQPVKDAVTGQIGWFYEYWIPGSARWCRWFNAKGETWIISTRRLLVPMAAEIRRKSE